jgi:hypothetical protein
MDQEERETLFNELTNDFFASREDAVWLYKTVRERVKEDFPDAQLSQRAQPSGLKQPGAQEQETQEQDEVREPEIRAGPAGGDMDKVEGNKWAKAKVSSSTHNILIVS